MKSVFEYAIAALAAASTLYGAVRFLGRRGTPRGAGEIGPKEGKIEVLSRTRVGFSRSLVLVRFEGRRILLGVTKGQWTALADLGRTPLPHQEPVSSIEAELSRVMNADRFRRGRRNS